MDSIPTVTTNLQTKNSKKSVSIMTTNHLKMGPEPNPKMWHIPNIPQITDNIQYNSGIICRSYPDIYMEEMSRTS